MKREKLVRLAAVIVALLVTVLSIAFGLRHFGYIIATALSGALIWGVLFFLDERKRRAGLIAGVLVAAVVQQVAYQACKAELPGFWWSLAQFAAVQFLVAYGIGRTAP
jgi:hypothetical protein